MSIQDSTVQPATAGTGQATLALARDTIRRHIDTFKQYATPLAERQAALAGIRRQQALIKATKAANPALARDCDQFDYWQPRPVAPIFVQPSQEVTP
ncbi:MAG: hypothetical protein LBR19_05695 [Bifidobacteriaceae bacterium]|jgi:hypothetical protein|nr:hypothetical protein [Bifidobacteriaceae bacterium]